MDSFSNSMDAGMRRGAFEPQGSNPGQKLATYILREFIQGLVSLRSQDLIANLLDLNAIEQFIGKRERCDVGLMLRQSVERNQIAASRRQIVFLIGIYGSLWAQADRAVLRRIFDKVISNAVKYSPPNSTIQVHALLENGSVIVNVRDQGTGINEEGRQKLFQKFAGLMACPAGVPGPTGVRSAIAKKLAETLSGSVRWRSALGSGSTFTLKLPVSTGQAETVDSPDVKSVARNIADFPQTMPQFGGRN
jgi:signal transduction histidine kinase